MPVNQKNDKRLDCLLCATHFSKLSWEVKLIRSIMLVKHNEAQQFKDTCPKVKKWMDSELLEDRDHISLVL